MMTPKFNLWIELDGAVVLSTWRVRLLETIEQIGSITGAAEAMSVPYRKAWERLREMEERMGVDLVKTEVGGIGGGGAKLTPDAAGLIERFHKFAKGMDEEVETRYKRVFADF